MTSFKKSRTARAAAAAAALAVWMAGPAVAESRSDGSSEPAALAVSVTSTRGAFRDVRGGSFRSYAGSWRIEPDGVGLRVTYTLDLRPRSSPPLFAKSIIASNARGLLEQVRSEIRRRAQPASSN